MNTAPNAYWEARKDILYYQVVRIICEHIGKKAESIIDVGSAGCPVVDWYPWIPERSSIDISRPYEAADVTSFKEDFLSWMPDKHYEIVTCLQVLEHITDAKSFAKKLLELGKTLIVTVPYKWKEDKTASHIHDPVDEQKMFDWFGREPNFQYVCTELKAPVDRLVQVYEPFPEKWTGLNRRDRVLIDRRKETVIL